MSYEGLGLQCLTDSPIHIQNMVNSQLHSTDPHHSHDFLPKRAPPGKTLAEVFQSCCLVNELIDLLFD